MLHDDQLHRYIEEELQRAMSGELDSHGQLERRLKQVERELESLRGHFLEMDTAVAKSMGLYEKAKVLANEREALGRELSKRGRVAIEKQVRALAEAEFDQRDNVMDSGTLDEQRNLIAAYVQKIEAGPEQYTVQVGLYPVVSQKKWEPFRFDSLGANS